MNTRNGMSRPADDVDLVKKGRELPMSATSASEMTDRPLNFGPVIRHIGRPLGCGHCFCLLPVCVCKVISQLSSASSLFRLWAGSCAEKLMTPVGGGTQGTALALSLAGQLHNIVADDKANEFSSLISERIRPRLYVHL